MRRTFAVIALGLVASWGCNSGGSDSGAKPPAADQGAGKAPSVTDGQPGSARPIVEQAKADQEKGDEEMDTPTTLPSSFHGFKMADIDGRDRDFTEFRGKVVLVVNVASKCGFTPQYAGLEELYQEYKGRGLVVLGVPSNDFGKQEPGDEAEIKEFCTSTYQVTFPLLAKVPVKNGPEQTPLYQFLSGKAHNGVLDAKVSWNFNKFLVGKDGKVIKHYKSEVKPDDGDLKMDIEKALQS